MEGVLSHPSLFLAVIQCLTIVTVTISSFLFAAKMHRKLNSKRRADEGFTNGLSVSFQLRMLLEGISIDKILKVVSESTRNRLYVAIRTSFFRKEEVWMVGHPAIVKEVFGPKSSKNWEKGDQTFTRKILSGNKDGTDLNRGMLYTGDDDGWRHARKLMTPFFYKKDFSTFDIDIDRIMLKHLEQTYEQRGGNAELLNMTLTITIDLIVQLLYGTKLRPFEFDCLVRSLAAYIVPGSPNHGTFPGGKSAFEYHREVGFDLGKKAKEGTLGSIIRNSDLPDFLKDENSAFFLEALTPALGSFWTICHVLLDKTGDRAKRCREDPVFRQQCIKEALRMYPPAPSLWPRFAKEDIEIDNPIYDERVPPKNASFISNLFGDSGPIESKKTIKIPKGTIAMVFPSVMHYDDRFWFEPNQFSPERWNNDPFILEMKSDEPTSKIANRNTANYGGLQSVATAEIQQKSRETMLEDSKNFFEKQKIADTNIRNFMFGESHEAFMADANYDRLSACTDPNIFEYQSWSFMPFGLGMHACMGRRLALRIVDATLFNFLKFNATFYHGIVPSMFTSKSFDQRIIATAAVYNMPADPVFVTVKRSPKKTKFAEESKDMRTSIIDSNEYRKSGIRSNKLSDLLAKALLEDDSDDSSDGEN